MAHPVAIRARRQVRRGPTLTAAQRNIRPVVQVYPQRAPDRIRQGDTPARPARVPIYTAQNRAGIKAVAGWPFLVRMRAPSPQASRPRGRQRPWVERSNIARPPSEAYGSQFGLDPTGKGMTAVPLAGVPG